MLSSSVRSASVAALRRHSVSALVCHQHVKLEENWPLESVEGDKVRVRMLMAPINPADLNQVEGTYAHLPPLPFVAGNEGVGEVVEVSTSADLALGDWVIPAVAGLGTWRPELVAPAAALRRIPKTLPVEVAATLLVNPCTAYRMLHDFVQLRPGDALIQNGANSAVGRAVIEIAKSMGVKTVNVVRDRPGFEALEQELRGLGGTLVVKAERLPLPETLAHIQAVLGQQRPRLALNCVGGQSATDLIRSLEPGAAIVTYGGMSKRPLSLPAGALIFSDIRAIGFWISAWYRKEAQLAAQGDHSLSKAREDMMTHLIQMFREGHLHMPPHRTHPLRAWQEALCQAASPYTGKKELFAFP